ncbi:MAG TPA: type I DNA topoisomerase [Methylomusa anaerophila]|uniref:DNA topoisomerase 1 n=1 Tax=Methylomusa anaerophila TaxID=1930071 RepID=A0A348AQ50_9FIRM|nr:type I DNA topoisomerase [Methylomusa anaerophila]BBB93198.1 DNA topoisomerase 1 [Methylomusa anaerophila]HML86970.1 type I DNA topoisomerase [Methylomusa anaerophila]
MSKALVVVESPAKAKTIEKFLGKNYTVKASMGHLRDLPKSQFGVDIENNFEPKYINIRGKGDLIKSLKEAAKNAGSIYLATDPDREGEAIAWHLAHLLNIPVVNACRIEFNEITKPAIQQAVKKPRPIDLSRVFAQQARRILDRIVGYKLSPLLWRKVRKGLSAGRVQSVAVRLICDREKEIQNFVPEEYWTITAKLKEKSSSKPFDAELVSIDGQKISIQDETQASAAVTELSQAEYSVADVKKRERKRNPYAPFITSSLQQEAARRIGFTSRKTMTVAQQLYEGLDIGSSGHVGLITYMRTDSTRVSELAQQDARQYIAGKHGTSYLPEKPPVYANKRSQDAHEAIRPTSVELPPEALISHLTKDQLKLYTLIWERFIASQMTAAVYDTMTIEIMAGRYKFRATGSQLKFPGFLAAFSHTGKGGAGSGETNEDSSISELDKDNLLPELTVGQKLKLAKLLPAQHFTEPPPRYTEASLVKILEEKGIGRPSTYAPTIETIVTRGYVRRVEKKFEPTELGFVVVDLLKDYFKKIVDVEFTAGMEDQLDDIADGDISWLEVLRQFYEPFNKDLVHAEEAIGHVELPVQVSDVKCENCGRMMVIKQGRYGDFLACPGFPECRNTKPLVKETGAKCPKCQGAVVERRTKRGKTFYGCENYPACDFTTWDTPLAEKCPQCGSFMVRHRFKNGGVTSRCSNAACPGNQAAMRNDEEKSTKVKRGKKSV